MAWTHLRFAMAMFWLTIGACGASAGAGKSAIWASPFILAGLAVWRRSADMPDRGRESVLLWILLGGVVLALLANDHIAAPSVHGSSGLSAVWSPVLFVPIWVLITWLFWRRFYPSRRAWMTNRIPASSSPPFVVFRQPVA
jgi:hypothetical protein